MVRNRAGLTIVFTFVSLGCQHDCHPRVYLRNTTNRNIRVELARTGPKNGLGPVPPGKTQEVFTSWSMGADTEARFYDAISGKLLGSYIVNKNNLAGDFECAKVTLRFPLN